jgi:DNA-binding transcriptional MerR regulator
MAQYSIKDLEHLTGIKAHTIRIWEKRYDIIQPKRTKTNIRCYSDEDARRLINISILNQHGFKISNISTFTDAEINEKVLYLTKETSQEDAQIKALALAMINLDEARFKNILSKAILSRGFEDAFMKVVFPFLDRIGVLWQTNAINPGQEHFITNLIRQKIIANIDAQDKPIDANSKRFILLLPEGELHELGLLFLAFLIKERGHQLLYLGQLTPLKSVVESEKIWPADIIVPYLVSSMSGIDPKYYADKLCQSFPGKTILFAGHLAREIAVKQLKNVHYVPDFAAFIKFLDDFIIV